MHRRCWRENPLLLRRFRKRGRRPPPLLLLPTLSPPAAALRSGSSNGAWFVDDVLLGPGNRGAKKEDEETLMMPLFLDVVVFLSFFPLTPLSLSPLFLSPPTINQQQQPPRRRRRPAHPRSSPSPLLPSVWRGAPPRRRRARPRGQVRLGRLRLTRGRRQEDRLARAQEAPTAARRDAGQGRALLR